MKVAVSALVLAAFAGSASAALESVDGPLRFNGSKLRFERGQWSEVPAFASTREPIVDIYDNTVTPITFGGAGAGNFLGDNLITTGTGDIRELEFSVGNAGAGAGTLTRVDVQIQVWELDPDALSYFQIGAATFDNIPVNVTAGQFTSLTATDLGISLTQTDILVLVRLSDPVGTGLGNLLQVRANPVAIGSSTNDLVVGNAVGPTGFGAFAGTNNNLWYRVAVPAPGSMALLGLGGLLAARRRR